MTEIQNVSDILRERATSHGDYKEHSSITQKIEMILRTGSKYETLSFCQRESLHMFAHKMGRIVCGNPDHVDHWLDVCGYSQLIVDQLRDKKK